MKVFESFRYTKFPVYMEAKKFYTEIVKVTKQFPRIYWELGDQMRRSALSVILNIAEGSAKKSDKDFNRYVKNSLGSVNECVAGVDVSYEEKLITRDTCIYLVRRASGMAKQLGGLSKSLK